MQTSLQMLIIILAICVYVHQDMPWHILTAPGLIFCTAKSPLRGGSDPVRKEGPVSLSSVVFPAEMGIYVGHRTEDYKLTDSSLSDR